MRLLSSALVAALALAVPAMAQDTAAKKPKATYSKKNVKTVTAKVKSIDVPTRHVVLTTPDGQDHEFVVGKQARNLPQVKVGDDVIVQYQEAHRSSRLEVDVLAYRHPQGQVGQVDL